MPAHDLNSLPVGEGRSDNNALRQEPGETPVTVGQSLREARVHYGQSLRDVANVLRIRVVYLQAIEEGRFEELPGTPYVIGFLRSYAEHFGLDGDEVVRRFRNERSEYRAPCALVFPEPVSESRLPATAMLVIALLVAIGGYGAWQYLGGESEDRPVTVADVPEHLIEQVEQATGTGNDSPMMTPGGGVESLSAGDPLLAYADVAADDPRLSRGIDANALSGAAALPDTGPEEMSQTAGMGNVMTAGADPKDMVGVAGDVSEPLFSLNTAMAAPVPGTQTAPSLDQPSEAVPHSADVLSAGQPLDRDNHTISPHDLGFPAAGRGNVPEDLAAEVEGDVDVASTGGATADVSAIEASATHVYGEVNTDSRVILRAVSDCWIQIKDAGGSEVFTRLLREGEIYKVPNRDGLLLRMGNAGGLEFIVDGGALPLLGQPGQVMRNVSLDPLQLQGGSTG